MADIPGPPDRDLTDDTLRMASAVRDFARFPGAMVHVVKNGSATWRRYAARAEQVFEDTDRLYDALAKGLNGSGKEASAVWRSQRAAVDAFDHRNAAEYAVIAVPGASRQPFTVVTFTRAGDDLRIVGAGTTHPGIADPAATESGLPGPAQLGRTAWYAVTCIAAKDNRSVVTQVPAGTWAGPRKWLLDRLNVVLPNGDLKVAGGDPRWPDAEVKRLSDNVTRLQPGMANPFPDVALPVGGVQESREWAARIADFLDRGGQIKVYDPTVPAALDAAEVTKLQLSGGSYWQGMGHAARIPGARTLVAEQNGIPRAVVTLTRSAYGSVQFLDLRDSGTAGGREALQLMAWSEGVRIGAPVVDDPGRGTGWHVPKMTDLLSETKDQLGDRVNRLPSLGWEKAGNAGADPGAVAVAVGWFRDERGDVVVLKPDDPQFDLMKEQVAGMMADAAAPAMAVDERLAGMWQAFNPPAGVPTELGADAGQAPAAGTAVAVAVDSSGRPVAAVGLRDTGHRIVLGSVGAAPEAEDDPVVAAVVDGVYRVADGRPVGGFVSGPMADLYREAGARTGGVAALEAEWLTRVEVSGPDVRRIVAETDRLVPEAGPRELNLAAAGLERFQSEGGALIVFDHATESGRRQAAKAIGIVRDDATRPATGGGVPADGQRLTVVGHTAGRPQAFLTIDSSPAGVRPLEFGAAPDDGGALAAVNYAVSDHVASRQPAPEHDGGRFGADHCRYVLAGMRNRLGERPRELLTAFGRTDTAGRATEQAGPSSDRPGHRRADGPERRQLGR